MASLIDGPLQSKEVQLNSAQQSLQSTEVQLEGAPRTFCKNDRPVLFAGLRVAPIWSTLRNDNSTTVVRARTTSVSSGPMAQTALKQQTCIVAAGCSGPGKNGVDATQQLSVVPVGLAPSTLAPSTMDHSDACVDRGDQVPATPNQTSTREFDSAAAHSTSMSTTKSVIPHAEATAPVRHLELSTTRCQRLK